MEQQLYELPEGWCLATLPKVVDENGLFTDGDWVESKDQDPSGDVRLIQLADIGVGEYRDRSSRFLTYDKAKELNCSFLRTNDILFARMPDPIGRACLFPGDEKQSVTVVDVAIIRPASKLVNANWLVYQINSPQFHASVVALQKGATRKRISRKNLATIQFPLPPLNEQKRIVAKLDALFTRIDAAITHLQETLELSKALFASALDEVFTKAANEFEVKPISKIFTITSGDGLTQKNMVKDGPYDVYGGNGISGRHNEYNRSGLNVVIGRVGAWCGNVRLVDGDIWVTDNAFFVKSYLAEVFEPYLVAALQHLNLRDTANQAAQPVISYKGIKELPIPLPSMKEQGRIVTHLDDLAEHTRTLEVETQERLDQLSTLKSSLLDSAFRGKL
ncbi:MAG: restriction endonuclease subunit S [Gammaproteobacteria bacterium]|nr:restriction endonuclease subunit S [Gammaproteobacteria bacterium]